MARSTTAHQRPWTAQEFIHSRVWELHFFLSFILSAKKREWDENNQNQSNACERAMNVMCIDDSRRAIGSHGMNPKSQFFFILFSVYLLISLYICIVHAHALAFTMRKIADAFWQVKFNRNDEKWSEICAMSSDLVAPRWLSTTYPHRTWPTQNRIYTHFAMAKTKRTKSEKLFNCSLMPMKLRNATKAEKTNPTVTVAAATIYACEKMDFVLSANPPHALPTRLSSLFAFCSLSVFYSRCSVSRCFFCSD